MTTPNTMEPEVRKVFSAPETGDYGAGASGAEFTQAYMNDFTMYPQQETLRSQRRTGDGQRDKGRLGRHNNTGEMNCELIVGVHDKYLEAVLGATFPTTGGGSLITPITAATIACVASGSQITDSGSGLGDLVDGMFVDVSGFTQNSGENNGIYYVSSPSASAATLYRVDGGSMTDEVAGDSVTITQLDMVANGRAVPSYEFEDVHDDVSPNVFKNYPGTVLPDFSLNFNNEIATARFGLLSPVAAISGAAARSGSLAYPSSPHAPCDSLSGTFGVGGAAARISDASVEVTRNLSGSKPLGTKASDEMFQGVFECNGSFALYAEDDSMDTARRTEAAQSLQFTTADPQGWKYEFYILYAWITDVQPDEGDLEAQMDRVTYEGDRHPLIGKTIAIRKVTS
jgi:hypothetical protein